MEMKDMLYEGKAKQIFATDDPDRVIMHFKDDATAFNAKKKGTIADKGVVNNKMSTMIFQMLEKKGVPTHLDKVLNDRDVLVKRVEIIPVEVVIRNVAAGSMAKRLGIEEGTPLKWPVTEFYYKSDELDDPIIMEDHVYLFDWATKEEMQIIKERATQVNNILVPFFDELGIRLIDYKIEFGRYQGEILLADEITPDGCRLWDKKTNEKLDKDRFRRDLGNIEEAYQNVLSRVTGALG
jgi:phosphoribosylaminoimidazole-succinocarboxamide synthase